MVNVIAELGYTLLILAPMAAVAGYAGKQKRRAAQAEEELSWVRAGRKVEFAALDLALEVSQRQCREAARELKLAYEELRVARQNAGHADAMAEGKLPDEGGSEDTTRRSGKLA